MLKLKHMNNFAKNGQEAEGLQDPSKRAFTKGIVAGVALAAVGVAGLNKYMVQESNNNELFSSLQGQEKNFEKVSEVAKMLIEEMDKNKLEKVKLLGSHPNDRIEILRSFLTNHIDSPIGNRYPFKNSLIISGYYTKENLEAIIKRTALFTDKRKWK
jgi:hypothetical protein